MTLVSSIAGLYEVFARYTLPKSTGPCPHCGRDEHKLLAEPLRELSVDTLRPFAQSALTTWGGVPELKHFLPRILEVMATQGFHWPDPEVIYGKLSYGGFRDWPADEVAAVRTFTLAHWADTISRYPAVESADSVLSGILLLGEDMSPCLELWERGADPRHLRDFVEANKESIHRRQRLGNAFVGEENLPGQRQIVHWITKRP